MDNEREPKVKMEPKSPRQELGESLECSALQRGNDVVMAMYQDQVQEWKDFSLEGRGSIAVLR